MMIAYKIPDDELQQLIKLYTKGYTLEQLQVATGYGRELIRRALVPFKLRRKVKFKCVLPPLQFIKHNEPPPFIKIGKYDEKFEEPINQGKFYNDYVRDGK
jgi:hypothetical protein